MTVPALPSAHLRCGAVSIRWVIRRPVAIVIEAIVVVIVIDAVAAFVLDFEGASSAEPRSLEKSRRQSMSRGLVPNAGMDKSDAPHAFARRPGSGLSARPRWTEEMRGGGIALT